MSIVLVISVYAVIVKAEPSDGSLEVQIPSLMDAASRASQGTANKKGQPRGWPLIGRCFLRELEPFRQRNGRIWLNRDHCTQNNYMLN